MTTLTLARGQPTPILSWLRWVLATIMLMAGLNKFVGFLPVGEVPAPAAQLMMALRQTVYFLPFLGLCQVVVALLLLRPRTVALGLVMMAPMSVHIVWFNVWLDQRPERVALALVVLGLNGVLAWQHRQRYAALLPGWVISPPRV